ncbi:hypothetical protein JOF53_004781 [Crossiella equi]|uniref:A-factor biosynthesis hotdog domain-containing protein n=2 Tax=Crossiella equi TaxID=130796 RepID=A0ABS5AH54_9PSEU|nr:ScbA/BarX family gamma-butyrolactone biosynthesis protein [Crossiella equi]MBP2475909.1 hypothetical protein [Crossiella equi]
MSGEEGFDTTVPRRLVHREAVAEVLLTRWVRRRTGEFWICAQLPRAHAFYQSQQGSADPLLVLETIRQAGLLVAHLGAGVPLEDRFVMRGMSYAVDSSALRVRDRPVDVQLLLRTRDVRVRPGHTSALGIEVELYRDGRRFGQGSGSMGTFPPAVYTRLRPPRVPAQATAGLPVPIDPVRVGRRDPADVVLSRGNAGNRWLLRVDTRHPALFDHPVDHVPGMVVFEAMRQAVHALAGPGYLASCQARTTRFVELDETAAGNVEVHALAASGGLFWTAVEQHGKRAASAVWRLSGNGGQFGPVS